MFSSACPFLWSVRSRCDRARVPAHGGCSLRTFAAPPVRERRKKSCIIRASRGERQFAGIWPKQSSEGMPGWRTAQKKRHREGGAAIFLPQEEVDRKSSRRREGGYSETADCD